MKCNKKLAPIPFALSLVLTGCIGQDDNDGIVDALRDQNELLEEQLQNSEAPVTLYGTVTDINDDSPLAGLTVSVVRSNTLLVEGTTDENGAFSIEGLPASSDLTVVVSSSDESYVQRAFYMTTGPVSAGRGYDDIGNLRVSAPVNIAFNVTDAQSGEMVTGLSFEGFSYSGIATSNFSNYAHETQFNTESQQYEITLPRDLSVDLSANLDLDGDGQPDYEFTSTDNVWVSGGVLYIYNARERDEIEIVLEQTDSGALQKTIAISLIDGAGTVIEGAVFSTDSDEGRLSSVFDANEGIYQIEVPFDGSATLEMPSFNVEDTTYSTGSVTLSRVTTGSNGETYIRVSSNGFDSNSYYQVADTEQITLVLELREVEPESTVEVVTSLVNATDFAYSVYYSEPVDVENVTLTLDDVTVIRGNASEDDAVPEGYTYILSEQTQVDVTGTSELNGVKHTFTPSSTLQPNTSYRYEIGDVTPLSGGVVANVDDDYAFTTPIDSSVEFDINDVILDNINYYTNGSLIVSENTAGVANSASGGNGSVYMLLPTSIEMLNYLVINYQSSSEGGVVTPNVRRVEIVRDGNIYVNDYLVIDAAANESIYEEISTSYILGSTAPDSTYIYRSWADFYLDDNTPESPVTVTFSYEYQTKAGETASGTLTLPVL